MTNVMTDAAVETSVLRINQKKPATLRRLLKKAGIAENPDTKQFWKENKDALRFWRQSGLNLDYKSKVVLSGAAIEFTGWDGTIPFSEATQKIRLKNLKPAAFYEVLLFAASNPAAFRRVLEQRPVIVQAIGSPSYLVIKLLADGKIQLTSTDRIDHIDFPVLIGGVYLT